MPFPSIEAGRYGVGTAPAAEIGHAQSMEALIEDACNESTQRLGGEQSDVLTMLDCLGAFKLAAMACCPAALTPVSDDDPVISTIWQWPIFRTRLITYQIIRHLAREAVERSNSGRGYEYAEAQVLTLSRVIRLVDVVSRHVQVAKRRSQDVPISLHAIMQSFGSMALKVPQGDASIRQQMGADKGGPRTMCELIEGFVDRSIRADQQIGNFDDLRGAVASFLIVSTAIRKRAADWVALDWEVADRAVQNALPDAGI